MQTVMLNGEEHVPGCDISRWQGQPNYAVFDLPFVIYKATGGDGGLYIDGMFKRNAAGYTTVEGPYHFAGDGDPVREANFHCDVLADSAWWDMPWEMRLPPTCDAEWTHSKPDGADWINRWCYRVAERINEAPFVYTGAYVDFPRPASLKQWELWLAAYTKNPISCPPWGMNYSLWQYGSTGRVSGIVGNVDTNLMKLSVYQKHTQPKSGQSAPQLPPKENPDMPLNDADKEAIRLIVRDVIDKEEAEDRYIARDEVSTTIFMCNEGTQEKWSLRSPEEVDRLRKIGFKGRGADGAINDDGASLAGLTDMGPFFK